LCVFISSIKIALINWPQEAEVAALNGSSDAYRLYDVAVRAAGNLDWVNEEGWALFLVCLYA